MKNIFNDWRRMSPLLVLAAVLCFSGAVQAAPQDLTTTNLALLNTVKNYNLGPTGMRGWMLSDSSPDPGLLGIQTRGSWQILVVTVGSGTPASGIMASNDVILGLSTGAGTPVTAWTYSATNDVRKSFGWAIGAAEAGDGKLNIKRWRAGVTTDVTIQLGLTNAAYSATAPYNCPKSAIILSNAGNIIAAKSFAYNNGGENGYPGSPMLALALLASGNTNYLAQVQTYARAIAPINISLTYTAPVGGGQPNGYGHSIDVWGWGYNGVFLAEYYLLTGDANVLPAINQFTLGLAQGQGRYGTIGHGCSLLDANGNLHGTMPPYGPVNSCGLVANLAIAMGKKAIVASGGSVDAEIPAAMDRAAKFFGYYVQKGGIPYGEHEPGYFHASNGKDSITALMFAMMGDRPVETEYWTRMVTAGYNGREYGHTGQGFSYLWGAMAASMGGTNAAIAYLKEIRWHLDLERRSDGSFIYDGSEQHGGSDTYDYWNTINYNSIDPTASYVLTYALAKQKLLITGKNLNSTNWLSAATVTNAIWAGAFEQVVAGYNTNQLVAALSEYDPIVRRAAAASLGINTNTSFSMVTNLASSTNVLLREAACQTLGYLQNTNALPLLAQRLTDTNIWVRAQAAKALQNFNSAAVPQLTNMVVAFTNNATDPNVIVWSDPLQIANGYLGVELFGGGVGSSLAANTNLLYPAVRVGLKLPDSNPRLSVASFAHGNLTLADVKALVMDILECAASESQADTMWSMWPRADSIATLASYNVVEAVPVALDMVNTPPGFGWGNTTFIEGGLNALATYGDSAHWTLPTLRGYASAWDTTSSLYATLAATITTISNAITSPVGLTNLFPMANPQVVVTTNAKPVTLTGYSCRTPTVTFTNVTAPAHGTLTGTAPNLTYTPTNGYVGLDSFTFKTADSLTSSVPSTVSIIVGTPAGNGLKGEYYDNADFTALKFTRTDAQVNFDWGTGSPSNTMAADTFSVRWSGLLLAPETGNYTFSTLNSDGVRLYVNGVQVIDDFVDQTTRWNDGTPIALTAGQKYEVQMDYYENTGSAVAKLKWAGPSFAGTNGVIIDQQWLYDGTGIANREAVAYSQSVSMVQNTNVAITLQGAANPPTYSINTSPTRGTLTGTPPNVIYTPTTNFNGTDSFTFVVNNGVSNSVPATVSITIWTGLPVGFYWTNTASANWSLAANWTNTTGAAVAPAATGQAFYTLNFNQAGSYTATHDLNNGFLLNQINLASSVTLAGTNALIFIGDGPSLPQIKQNSGNGVTISTPISMATNITIGGSGTGDVNIYGGISGASSLTKNNGGTLALLATNTYTGGTMVNAGTLYCGLQNSSPLGGAGSVNVTVQSGAALAMDRNQITGSLTLNGGMVAAGNGWGDDAWNGPVILAAISTIDVGGTDGALALTGVVSGPGGLIKLGTSARAVTLSGTNTYTGATMINAGTLSFTKAASLGAGTLSITDGAFANLNYTGTRIIASLTFGGTNQTYGTYGATNSTAPIKDTHFTGTGTVTVLAAIALTNSSATSIAGTSASLNATLGCGGTNATVYVHWNTINGGTNTALWTNSATVGVWTNVTTTNLSYSATGLIAGTTYYFTFRGTNAGGNVWPATVQSFTTFTVPVITGQPVSVTNIEGTTATFAVTATGAGLAYQWKKGATTLSNGGNVSGATTATLTLTSLTQADAAGYSVVITNGAGTATSATATLTVISVPVVPTGLFATATSGQVALGWTASSGATGYNLKRTTTSGSGYATIATPSGTTYTDSAVVNGTTYYYVVSASNSAGISANSAEVGATPNPPPAINVNYAGGANPGNAWMNGYTSLDATARGSASQVAPADYGGTFWNDFNGGGANSSNLKDSAGVSTGIGLTTTMAGGPWNDWNGLGGNRMLVSGLIASYASYTTIIALTGLATNHTYDLYIAALHNTGVSPSDFRVGTVTNHLVNVSGVTDWKDGTNYVRFTGLIPTNGGTLTVDAKTTAELDLNGFQLRDTTPQKDILSFTFPTYGNATISGTNITMTVPYGTAVTALSPTHTLSYAAACVPASGSAQNFSSPVLYTVTASDSSTKTYLVTVTVRAIPDPVFTLAASTNFWNGRQTMTVTANISNWSLLVANNGTNLNYNWSVAGVAATRQVANGTMTLTYAQGNGQMVVTLVMDNGGWLVTNTAAVTVQQPASDAWVQRTPGANEKPENSQFFARDDTGFGTVYYNGTIGGSPNSVFLKIYTNGPGGDVLYTNISQVPGGGGDYAFTAKIAAGLVNYKVVFGSVTGVTTNTLDTVTNVVCGDAYLLDGQSNTLAETPNGAADVASDYTNVWIRSYGNISTGATNGGWGTALRTRVWASANYGMYQVGAWGMDIGSNLLAKYSVPICIINGAVGGTRIDQHLANPTNHYVAASLYSIYANLLNRVAGARLTHGIRGVLWHQGEQDQGVEGPYSGDYDYKYYQQNFVNMSGAWKQDYPNIKNYYIYQIWPAACGDTSANDMLRETQRTLPSLYSNMRVMSTLGIVPGSGCHFVLDGYMQFSVLMSPLVEQDNYGLVPAAAITAADLKNPYFTTSAHNEIAMEFGQPMIWNNISTNHLYLDGASGKVASATVSGNVIKLRLTAASTAQTITYLKGIGWDSNPTNLIYGSNGIAALTFASVPITSQATIAPQPPTGLAAIPLDSLVNLSWTASFVATGYNVKRSTTSGSGYTIVGTTSGTNYADSTVVNDTTYYYVVSATNSVGESANSSEVSALPKPMPVITSQPVSLTNYVGTTATFTVTASGTSLTYQWKKGAVNMANTGNASGTLTATLTLTSVNTVDATNYSVVITNVGGAVSSATATLTVLSASSLPVTSGLVLRMDAAQIATNNGAVLSTWTDTSGAANNAVRQGGSSAGYPQYVTNVVNGQPVVRFNSANGNTGDYFQFTRITTIRTVFWVFKENAGLSDGHFLLGDDTTYQFHRASANGPLWDGGNASGNITGGTTKLMGNVINGTTTSLPSASFQLVSLVTAGNVPANQICQDRVYHGSWQGDIAEILIYTNALSGAEELQVGTYLSAKYGLTTAYPVTTPPATPTGLSATPTGSGTVSVSWTASFSASGYNVSVSNTVSTAVQVATTTNTTYTFTGLSNGTRYEFAVAATNSVGASAYSATVSATPAASLAKNILTFVFPGQPTPTISGTSISVTMPVGTVVTALAPTYTVSALASGSPVSGTTRDFTSPKTYTITADDLSTQVYTVTVTLGLVATNFTWTTGTGGTWSDSTKWVNELANGIKPTTNGLPYYNLNFNQAVTTTNDLSTNFVLNKLNFGNTVTIATNNSLQFISSGAILPMINQNSGNQVTIASPISLIANTTIGGSGSGQINISGNITGAGSLTKTNGGTLNTSGGNNTYTGGTMINAGTVYCGLQNPSPLGGAGSVNVTVQSGAALAMDRNQITGTLTLNGGKVATGNGWSDDSWTGPVALTATSTIDVGGTDGALALNGVVSGPGGLIKLGTSNRAVSLNGVNTFTGTITISQGTIALGAAGSISNVALISIAAGATFDVSSKSSPYYFSSTNALAASGTATAANLKGAINGTVDLKSQPITLTYNGANPALTISQGALALNANPFTVNNASALAVGAYNIINQITNTAIASSGTYPSVTGTAIGAGNVGAISVSGTNVVLTISLSPPTVANTGGATNLAISIAQLRGTLTNGPADVRLYWGATDGGTTAANWSNVILLSAAATGSFSSNVSNLIYGVTYYYRSYASNITGSAWAATTTNFTTLRPASSLSNSPATSINTNAATLNSTLACTGAVYQVSAYWNTVNGGTNISLWTNTAYLGAWTNVAGTNLNYSLAGLVKNTTYYFTFRATNALDVLWATNVQSFATLAPPALRGSAMTWASASPGFSFAPTSGFKYRLTYKSAMTNAAWLPVIAPPNFPLPDGWSATSTGSLMSISDTNTAGQIQRFYRIESAYP